MSSLIQKYLLDEAPKRKLDEVIANCRPFLEDLKASGWNNTLHKGSNTKLEISKGSVTPIYRPSTYDRDVLNKYYELLKKQCGIDLEKKSVMCYNAHGDPYMVPGGSSGWEHFFIPIGDYKLYSNPDLNWYRMWRKLGDDRLFFKSESDPRNDLENILMKEWNPKYIPEIYKVLPKGMYKEAAEHSGMSRGNVGWNLWDAIFAPEALMYGRPRLRGYDDESLLKDWGPNAKKWMEAAVKLFRKAIFDGFKQVSLKDFCSDTFNRTCYVVCSGYYLLKDNDVVFEKLKKKFK